MNKLLKAKRFCHVISASEVLFEVENNNKSYIINNKKSYMANLKDYMCDCALWKISGLPYNHVMPSIAISKAIYKPYVPPCFTKDIGGLPELLFRYHLSSAW